jgi:hypothetical protein
MSVKNITFGDVLASAAIDDIDAALLPLMKIAGIDDGGIAGIVFSGGEAESWPQESMRSRAAMLCHWMAVEYSYERNDR